MLDDIYWLGSQLSGRSLFFTSVIPILFNLDFTPSSFSLVWGLNQEGNLAGPVSSIYKVGLIQLLRFSCRTSICSLSIEMGEPLLVSVIVCKLVCWLPPVVQLDAL